MLATLGDLVEDIVVRVDGAINVATDTTSVISRRRGGSAANVAATAALLGHPIRFIGQVGVDPIGAALVDELAEAGVDVRFVSRAGSTGTIVVLVDDTGERSMLTDRRTCIELADPVAEWLDGVTVVHVPLYSLVAGATATTARTVIGWAHDRSVAVSLDLSSTSLLADVGVDEVRGWVRDLQPTVVFANSSEAEMFGLQHLPRAAIVVVKDGPGAALLRLPGDVPASGDTLMIPAIAAAGVPDTTGAGDAFAAGFLGFRAWRDEPAEACIHAHRAAHRVLTTRRS